MPALNEPVLLTGTNRKNLNNTRLNIQRDMCYSVHLYVNAEYISGLKPSSVTRDGCALDVCCFCQPQTRKHYFLVICEEQLTRGGNNHSLPSCHLYTRFQCLNRFSSVMEQLSRQEGKLALRAYVTYFKVTLHVCITNSTYHNTLSKTNS